MARRDDSEDERWLRSQLRVERRRAVVAGWRCISAPAAPGEPPARALLGELIADYWAEKLLAG
jgi:hypothetical protein